MSKHKLVKLDDEAKNLKSGEVAINATGFFASQQGPFEEFNPDILFKRKGFEIYQKMMADDQIFAAFQLISSSISARQWHFESNEDNKDIADFFDEMIRDRFIGKFTTVIEELLLAMIFGFVLLEKIYEIEEFDGKSYWIVKQIKSRPLNTFTFEIDKFGNIINLLQRQDQIARVKLDINKFIHYVYQPYFHPQYGRSILVPVYRHYWSKDNIIKFWNIYLERAAVGFIHGKVAGGDLTSGTRTSLEDSLSSLSAKSWVITPDNIDLEYVTQNDMRAFELAIEHRDRAMARCFLIPHTLGVSPQGNTGTQAQSSVHFEEVFFHWIIALAGNISETLDEQVFIPLGRINFGKDRKIPKFKFDELTEGQKEKAAKSWAVLVKDGAVHSVLEDENHVRKLMNFPEIEEEDIPDENEMNPISTADDVLIT